VRADIARRLTQSAQDFQEIVWPRIAPWCGGGQLIPVESVTAQRMAKMLDLLAGIDAWQVNNEHGVRGITSRVQWGYPHNSFTVRARTPRGNPTELEKRLAALDSPQSGWLFPALTCQAYLDRPGGRLLSVGLARTADVCRQAHDKVRRGVPLLVSPTGEEFMPVYWLELQEKGIRIRCWRKED